MKLSSYFQSGYNFQCFKPKTTTDVKKLVILIHGWGVRGDSMRKFAEFLTAQNFTVYNYDYPSSQNNIAEHAKIFLEQFRKLNIESDTRIHFATHSMGGLILRSAMLQMSESECKQIQNIVMLGPPNKGSFWGRFGDNKIVRKFNRSLGDMSDLPHSFVNQLPMPEYFPPTLIIGGTRDGKVAKKNLPLPNEVNHRIIMVKSSHPGLRFSAEAMNLTCRFFENSET
ncbi:MAG: alpha/beta hydrolase [Lentisphaeria bacterium]|nr:alpha/beta hydrolase [Lentisphaeria bacterium]